MTLTVTAADLIAECQDCVLCNRSLSRGTVDGSGVAHAACARDVFSEIDADAVTLDPHPSTGFGSDEDYIAAMEADYAGSDFGPDEPF